MFTIICYDTPSDRRRRRLAKASADFVARVQKSVFEGHLTPDQLRALLGKIQKVIDLEQDSVRVYQLPADALADVRLFGKPPLNIPQPLYWVGPEPESGAT